MSSGRPKCGAKTRAGGTCQRAAAPNNKRCIMHGGHPKAGAQPVHGRYSARFARIDAVAQEAIEAALADPQLMDLRRPVALQAAIIQDAPVMPSDALVEEFARRLSRWRPDPAEGQTWEDQPAPTEAELSLARMTWAEKASETVERWARVQAQAAKQIEARETLSTQIIPAFAELGVRLTKLAARFVPAEQRTVFDEAFRVEVRRCIADIVAVGDDG